MPWIMRKEGPPDHPFCVVRESDGKQVACFANESDARQMIRAMYAGEPSASADAIADGASLGEPIECEDVWQFIADAFETTSLGGLRATAYMTTEGVFPYPEHGLNVLRPLDSIASSRALASMADMPITVGHPDDGVEQIFVTPDNFRELAVGHVSGVPVLEGNRVKGRLVIQDAATARDVRSGKLSEVSQAYAARIIRANGITPDGKSFDAIQVGHVYNHNALLRRGQARLGRGMTVHADATEESNVADKKTITIGGIPYPADSDAVQAAIAQVEAQRANDSAALATLTGRLDAMQHQIEEQNTALETSRQADAKRALDALKSRAKILTGDADLSALATERAVKERAILAANPKAHIDGKADQQINAAFDEYVAVAEKRAARGPKSATAQAIAAASTPAAQTQTQDAAAAAATIAPISISDADGSGHTAQAAWDRMVARNQRTAQRS